MNYPPDWPVCPNCGKPALDGHITCGSYACGEHRFRRQRADQYARSRLRVVAPPNDAGGPVTCFARPVYWPDGTKVMADDLIPGAVYEVDENGILHHPQGEKR